MRTFEFNRDGDWTLGMVEGQAEVQQSVEHAFKTRLSEWFLDESIGLDRTNIESRDYRERDIADDLRETALQDERVLEVLELKLDFDRRARKLRVWIELLAEVDDKEERVVFDVAI